VKELVAIAATLPKPKPVPMVAAAVPTPSEGIKAPRPSAGTLAPATLERWERRVTIFAQMLQRAFPSGSPRPDLTAQLKRVEESLARMSSVRERSMREQLKLEAIVTKTRESQGRFGRAMDTLGKDLSHAREEIQKAKEYGETLKRSSGSFSQLHAQIAKAPATPTRELDALYRQALAALEQALSGGSEQSKIDEYVKAKEQEITDTQFQIDALRAQLERLSKGSEDERAEVQKAVEQLGVDIAGVEQTLIADASTFANALRGRGELKDLFAELEMDAA
jgi:chromosome segregation ATPase